MPRAATPPKQTRIPLSSRHATPEAPASKPRRFVPPPVRPVTDDTEAAAFRPLAYSRGSGRFDTTAAAEQAKLRMLGRAPGQPARAAVEPEPEPDDDDEPEPESEDNSGVERQPPTPPTAAPTTHFVTGMSATLTPTPAPTPTPTPVLSLRAATVDDLDRLWDWVRADGDHGASFFSKPMPSSVALHTFVSALGQAEVQGLAAIRSVVFEENHLGFAMLLPILASERTAMMHIYLRADVRGHLAQLVPTLVDLAAQTVPGYALAVISHDATLARMHRALFAPLGFAEHTMFLRQP